MAETARTADQARAQAAAQAAGQQQNAATVGDETFTAFAKALSQSTPAIRLKIAQQLKNANLYKGKVSGEFNNRFYDALLAAEKKRVELATVIEVPSRYDFIAGLAADVASAGVSGGISKVIQSKVYTDTDAKKLIDAVIQDQLGRKASADEVKKYTSMIQAAQKKSPTVTTYKTVGGVQTATTTGGINEQQYLLDRIAGTDEAKANKVLGFYETFMNALGRD